MTPSRNETDGEEHALETKDARAIFPQYDELRINLRENADLLARNVERDLDWHSDRERDAAKATVGVDPVSRIAHAYYNFQYEDDGPMPDLHPGKTRVELPLTEEMRRDNPNAHPLVLDRYSVKHQLLTLYFCFEVAHRKITAVRQRAGGGAVDASLKATFTQTVDTIGINLNREAERLNDFLMLAAGRIETIETIEVKFRPGAWYCHVPLMREIIGFYSKSCTPIRTAQNGSMT